MLPCKMFLKSRKACDNKLLDRKNLFRLATIRPTIIYDTIRLFHGRGCGGLHNAITRLNGFLWHRGAA
jgi:hypothetical protein